MFVLYYKPEAIVAGILEWSEYDRFHFIHWEVIYGLMPTPPPALRPPWLESGC